MVPKWSLLNDAKNGSVSSSDKSNKINYIQNETKTMGYR